jgi:hypothetical protein
VWVSYVGVFAVLAAMAAAAITHGKRALAAHRADGDYASWRRLRNQHRRGACRYGGRHCCPPERRQMRMRFFLRRRHLGGKTS